VQRYACDRCGKSFSESQPLDGLRIEHSKVVQIVKLLCEGMGIRATARQRVPLVLTDYDWSALKVA
jgi:transposase-like protein